MRPPPSRLSSILFHHHLPSRTFLRFSSTASTPSLLTVRDVPAPHLGHIRIVSLNDPKCRNAISRQLLSDLRTEIYVIKEQVHDEEARGEVVGEGTRVLILASEVDEAFCAGAHLKERKDMSKDETNAFLTTLRSTFHAIETLPVPTISAVASSALGGGLELALATDIRIFASTALLGLPETRLGIIPGAGGTYRLQQLIGKAAALNMILTGRRVGGAEALRVGLAQCSITILTKKGTSAHLPEAREKVLDAAISTATNICGGAPGAVQAALRAVREGTAEAEGREYERVVGMEDRDEALRAFGEKRAAVFKGR